MKIYSVAFLSTLRPIQLSMTTIIILQNRQIVFFVPLRKRVIGSNDKPKGKQKFVHDNIAGILNKIDLFEITITDLANQIGDIDFIV